MDDLPDTGFALVRCADRAVVAYFESFPECSRALMYRKGDMVSFMPLGEEDIVGTPSLFTMMLERAGYRVSGISDILR
ncbi:TPA: hypothetical protein QHC20_004810 [Raoultella ornithinolytica]|uniref:hypothetical protein n=1 Tax=Raoultella terrigena TaxID=577 RepID=UPI0027E8E940|nr:hypothetical protein [Raoultella ornithinolytica]HDT5911585.1 hypothetical protein [Raoultella ornithinolytica]HDT5917421.1 hypothetical protein [Raoultella ornithinolytica]HDT5967421.1 hypothetical protein [Raoultella ornithinolytica]HDT6012525.1 hypothetical protein [Raoultella ornithinolytica]